MGRRPRKAIPIAWEKKPEEPKPEPAEPPEETEEKPTEG